MCSHSKLIGFSLRRSHIFIKHITSILLPLSIYIFVIHERYVIIFSQYCFSAYNLNQLFLTAALFNALIACYCLRASPIQSYFLPAPVRRLSILFIFTTSNTYYALARTYVAINYVRLHLLTDVVMLKYLVFIFKNIFILRFNFHLYFDSFLSYLNIYNRHNGYV